MAGFLQYFVENVGNYAMGDYQSVRGYTYDVDTKDISSVTQTVIDAIADAKTSTAWWEAYMNDETKATAQDNIQSVLNGDMNGAAYMDSIEEAYTISN